MDIHIHFDGYAPQKPALVAEDAAEVRESEETKQAEQAAIAQRDDDLARAERRAGRAVALLSKYQDKFSALQAEAEKEYQADRIMPREGPNWAPRKEVQAALTSQGNPMDASDDDLQYRLMRKYANGGTLTPAEFDFLRRRGCVRY
mgnify:CR=1 FL=1